MKKKIFLLLLIVLCITGCNEKKKEIKNIKKDDNVIEGKGEPSFEDEDIPKIDEYIDENNTPIGIYLNRKKITEIKSDMTIGKDIVKFQVFPSNEDYLSYSGAFGQFFHNRFSEYNKNNNLKVGVNLTYDANDGRHVSHTVLHASDAKEYEGYILLFLYDDYDLYINNKIYSHFEPEQETNKTIISSIKLYPGGAIHRISSKVIITVFTYDSDDDFDSNGEYRGNSKYTITLCENGKTC